MSDPLSTILDTIRLSSSIFSRAILRSPWSVISPQSKYGIFHVVLEGRLLAQCEGEEVELGPGAIALLPGGAEHVLTSRRGLPSTNIRAAPGRNLPSGLRVMELGGSGDLTSILCGTVRFDRSEIHPVLGTLPAMIWSEGSATTSAVATAMSAELEAGVPGTASVITRLADAAIASSLRAGVAQAVQSTSWTAGLRDPRIARALAAIHAQPEVSWSADELAGEAGMSRSSFYERFVTLVGEPPRRYLTRWRMHVAARCLQTGSDGLADIAEQVGYASEVSFSKAFKQVTGQTPGAWRRRMAA